MAAPRRKFKSLASRTLAATLLLGFVLLTAGGCISAVKWDGNDSPRSRDSSDWANKRPVAPGSYQVKPGDTLYSIAFRYRLDYKDVARWNGIGGSYLIRPGQTLRLTAPQSTVVRSSGGAAAPPPANTGSGPPRRPPARPTPPTRQPDPQPTATTITWAWPTPSTVKLGYTTVRQGVVFGGTVGNAVKAAASGTVVYSGSALKGYGKLVIIKHSEEFLSAYGYNRRLRVSEGDTIRAGQTIAEMGVGPAGGQGALRFEIRKNGEPINPLGVLPRR